MRSSSLPLLLGCAIVLALPVAASAQNYDPILTPEPFDDLPINGTTEPVTTLVFTGYAYNGYAAVQLPFPFVFYNEFFNDAVVTTSGLVIFGQGTTSGFNSNTTIPNTADPNGFIAAWWDYNYCDPAYSSVKTQVSGPIGSRIFVIEWNGCRNNSSTAGSGRTMQMQVRLTENSAIPRVYYGTLGAGTTTMSGTIGIENPPQTDPTTGAPIPNTAGTRGKYAPLTPTCTTSCAAASWPTNSMIQWGRPTLPDLQAGKNTAGYKGLRITGLNKGPTQLTATLENNIENAGLNPALSSTWNYYLSADSALDASDTLLPCGHTTPETLNGYRSPPAIFTFDDTCTFNNPPSGSYRICTQLSTTSTQASTANDSYCSDEFVLGSDLIGGIGIMSQGGLGSDTTVGVHLENRGSDPTGEFGYEVLWHDCYSPAAPGQSAYTGLASLGGGESLDLDIDLYLAPNAEGETICAELVVDGADAIDELVESNNTASTCYEPSKTCMELTRPDLDINTVVPSFPHGCFFGDLVNLDMEVCNNQGTVAKNFGVVFNIDHGSTVTLWDTQVIAVPQACKNKDANGVPYPDNGDSQCMDIGGGAPRCVNGICHAPCVSDADCGVSGLECLEDPDVVIGGERQQSCQLMLAGGECKTLHTSANLPTFNSFSQADFEDGYYFIGGIIDWTMLINEGQENEGNNKGNSADKYFCWTRKPDFQPTEVRSLGVIGAGEQIPVYRRIHNNGVLGGVYSYRYVLSSNTSPSVYDIPLAIVGYGEIADGTVEAFGDSTGTDMVVVPAGVVAGDYYLGIIIDPLDTVLELDEGNNAFAWCDPQANGSCLPHVVRVVDSSLRVVTPTLRDATVGQSYNVQLLATGGNGNYAWTVTSGALPPGLVLDESGLLHGTVLEQGYYTFQVTVTSGAASASATFVIHGSPARGPLAIATDTLPPAYIEVVYRVELGASGGVPPYSWTCSGLPNWLQLQNNVLGGTPHTVAAPLPVHCTVTDANLSTVTQSYAVQVMAQSTVAVKTTRMEGTAGVAMLEYVTAEGGSGNYSWDFDDATIPAGLAEVDASPRGALSGTPLACGSFLVGVTVTDTATGTTDSADILLTVVCDAPVLSARNLPVAVRNEPYLNDDGSPVQLQAEGAVSYEIVMGDLPRGLELSSDGLISGTVAVDANPGDYNVAIELTDSFGAKGLGAVTVVVRDPPAPNVIITEKVTKGGCSTTGEASASGFLPFAALFALLGLRRASARRSAGVALVAAAAALLPAVASAQTTRAYASFERSMVYQRLTDATPVPVTSADDASAPVNLPFTFTFFGEQYDRVHVSTNGVLLFSAANTSSTNAVIPSSTAPNNFIAPWFDDLELFNLQVSNLRYTIRGTEPNREIVFEWIWQTGYSSSDGDAGGEMQVSLHQDGDIAMRWGDVKDNGYSSSDFTASIGLEDSGATAKSVPYLACTTNSAAGFCKSVDWTSYLKDKEVTFTTLPNLSVVSTATLAEGRAGLQQEFHVTVKNNGPKPVTTSIELVASVDEYVSDDDVSIIEVPAVAVGAFGQVTHDMTTVLPRSLAAGRYYLLARLDGANAIKEWSEADNDGGTFQFRVVPPAPDLSLDWIGVPSSGSPGSMISVDLTVSNLGNADAIDVPFAVVISPNESITGGDLPLYTGTVSVNWQETEEFTAFVEIPSDIPAGLYYIGGVIDPAAGVDEFDKLNNFRAADHGFTVAVDGLRISTHVPVELQVGAPFCIPLVAEGGDGVYTWSVRDGTLPPGVDLNPGGVADPDGGSLCGEPTTVGIYAFTLEVESGGMTAESQLSLNIVVVPMQLTVASKSLPIASFQHAYEAGFFANGGRPPYRWEITSGTLPAGLTFDTDGLLFGTPLEEGTYTIAVKVTDAANNSAAETLRLIVAPPARVTCSSRTLGMVPVAEQYTGKLLAGGGTAPYTWETVSTLRLGDAGAADIPEGMGPPGIILGSTGELSGAPSEIGRYLWTVDVTDVTGRYTDTCSISLEVVADHGLTVTTTALPIALVGEDFGAKLEADGGVGPLKWAIPQESDLPGDLELGDDGFISGSLGLDLLQGQESRTFSFLVEVRDEQNNRGVASLSVTLREKLTEGEITHVTKTTESGCSTSAGGFSLLALGLVVLGLRRRR